MQYIREFAIANVCIYCKLTELFLLKITGIGCMNTVLLTILHSKTYIFIENDFDVSLFYSISYLFINKNVHMLHIYSHYLMKLHEFFFFLQAHAGIFFSSSISCMNFFFGSDTPPPRISNGPPLISTTSFLKPLSHWGSILLRSSRYTQLSNSFKDGTTS